MAGPDLQVRLTTTSPQIIITGTGPQAFYTATVSNQGSDATGVVLTMQTNRAMINPGLPAGASYDADTGLVTLPIGTVSQGTSLSYNFSFQFWSSDLRTATNGAEAFAVASAVSNEGDSNPADNMNQRLSIPISFPAGSCTGGIGYDGKPATQGLTAEYFKGYFNDDLTYFDASNHSPAFTRTEGALNYFVNYIWGDLSDASTGIASNPDEFSTRFRGTLTIVHGGTYTFSLSSDDASYMWVGEAAQSIALDRSKATVDAGGLHAANQVNGTPVTLAAGTYPILILYGDATAGNFLQVSYSGPDTNDGMAIIPQSALCTFTMPAPVTDAHPDLKVSVSADAPEVVINSATTQYLTFTTTITNAGDEANDVVLTMQGPRAAVNTNFPSGTSYSAATGVLMLYMGTISQGATVSRDFTFQLAPNNQRTDTNGAEMVVVASATGTATDANPTDNTEQRLAVPVRLPRGSCGGIGYDGQPTTQGLSSEYYRGYFNDDFSFFDQNTPLIKRTDAYANYYQNDVWGDLIAVGGSNPADPDAFSTRLRGTLTIRTSGSYTFRTSSDDASYVWVGESARATQLNSNLTVVQSPGNHAASNVDGAPITLAAGSYPIQILYGDWGVNNSLQLSYSGPDTNNAMTLIPQTALCTLDLRSALPVVLTSFTATAVTNRARLNWATASEHLSGRFDVERSYDGAAFVPVGSVAATGTTTRPNNYSFVDEAPSPNGGIVYYRLHQIDTDGTTTYSQVQSLSFASTAATLLRCYPNPAQGRTTLDLPAGPAGQLTLRNALGQVVRTIPVPEAATQLVVELQSLAAGVYQLQVQSGSKVLNTRLLLEAK
jgi:hypothetical protein